MYAREKMWREGEGRKEERGGERERGRERERGGGERERERVIGKKVKEIEWVLEE